VGIDNLEVFAFTIVVDKQWIPIVCHPGVIVNKVYGANPSASATKIKALHRSVGLFASRVKMALIPFFQLNNQYLHRNSLLFYKDL